MPPPPRTDRRHTFDGKHRKDEVLFKTKIAGFNIIVSQSKNTNLFHLSYGKEIHFDQSYAEATDILGRYIFHALACEGKLLADSLPL